MAKRRTSTRLAYIGRELSTLRCEKGLLLDSSRHRLDRSPSSLSQIENGQTALRRRDLKFILDAYGVPDGPYKNGLLELCDQDRAVRTGSHWWDEYEGVVSPAGLDVVSLEFYAASFESVNGRCVPGLCQIASYTEAVMTPALTKEHEALTPQMVAFRQARQQVLHRPDPIRLHSILDEAVLRRPFGGPRVLRAQLEHLLELSELPHVTFQVLPFSCASNPAGAGSFCLLNIGDPLILQLAMIDIVHRRRMLDDKADVDLHRIVFDQASAAALSETASRDMILRVLSEP
jgi:hypothetical protein